MLQEHSSEKCKVSQRDKFKAFYGMVRDSALEQWPLFKPVYKWFVLEAKGMRQGFIFCLVCIIATSALTWWITFSYMNHGIITSKNSAMVIHPDYETAFKQYYLDQNNLAEYGKKAYMAADYPYSVKFFSRTETIAINYNWYPNYPYYAAAELAQDPTVEGYNRFEEQLNGLVEKLKQLSSNPNYRDKSFLGGAIQSLSEISERVPDNEKAFVMKIGDEIVTIKNNSTH